MSQCRHHDYLSPHAFNGIRRVDYSSGSVVRSVMETTTNNQEGRAPWYHEPWGLVWICSGYVLMDIVERTYQAFRGTLPPSFW